MTNLSDLDFCRPLGRSLYLLEAPNRMRFPHGNSFLLTGTEVVLIDAGIGAERITAVDRIRRIDTLLISHSHPDHILSWPTLHDRRILLPQQTPDTVHDLDALGRRFTGSRSGGEYWARRMRRWFNLQPLPEPSGRFADGERLDFGGPVVEPLHAPGHLADHYCFFEHTSRTLLTTDIDFTGFGPWYGNPEGDIRQFEIDIRRMQAIEYDRVCSAHKPPVSKAEPDPFEAFLASLKRQQTDVLALCRHPQPLEALVAASPFYHDRFPDKAIQDIFETNLVRKTVDFLVQDGRLSEIDGYYRQGASG